MDRRRYLQAATAVGLAGLAGCPSGSGDDGTTVDTREQTTAPTGTTAAPQTTEAPTDTETTEEPTTEDEPAVPRGGRLVQGLPDEPVSANPMTSQSGYDWAVMDLVYPGGARYDPATFDLQPHAFSDWTVEPGSNPDVHISVRDGLQWNDGTEFSVDDVLFTYDYVQSNPAVNRRASRAALDLVEPSGRSGYDVHLGLAEPMVNWDARLLTVPLVPESQWRGRDPNAFDPTRSPAGTVGLGPGTITSFQPDRVVVEFTNEAYGDTLGSLGWIQEHDDLTAGGPFLDAVEFQVFEGESSATSAFFSGTVDTLFGGLDTDDAARADRTDGLGIVDGIESGYSYLGFNLRRTPVDDVPFRQAVAMCYDESFVIDQLLDGRAHDGDVPHSIGHPNLRPETVFDGDLGADPALEAYSFRGQAGRVDVQAIRSFLEDGEFVDGGPGTYAGQSYPGSLSGATTSIDAPLHDYAFGEVQTALLDTHGADAELYVNGQTIPEILGRPLEVLTGLDSERSTSYREIRDLIGSLRDVGVPVRREAIPFDQLVGRVFSQEDFDVYPASWPSIDPMGASLQGFFHSDHADDHSEGQTSTQLNNPLGYGLFDYADYDTGLNRLETTMDPDRRAERVATALERIYLDCPLYVTYTEGAPMAVNSADWTGFVADVVEPGDDTWSSQVESVHRVE